MRKSGRIGAVVQRLETDAKLRVVMAEFLNQYREFYQKTSYSLKTTKMNGNLKLAVPSNTIPENTATNYLVHYMQKKRLI